MGNSICKEAKEPQNIAAAHLVQKNLQHYNKPAPIAETVEEVVSQATTQHKEKREENEKKQAAVAMEIPEEKEAEQVIVVETKEVQIDDATTAEKEKDQELTIEGVFHQVIDVVQHLVHGETADKGKEEHKEVQATKEHEAAAEVPQVVHVHETITVTKEVEAHVVTATPVINVEVTAHPAAEVVQVHQHPAGVEVHQHPAVVEVHQHPVAVEVHQHPVIVEAHQHPAAVEVHQHPAVVEVHQHPAVVEVHQHPAASEVHQHATVIEVHQTVVEEHHHPAAVVVHHPTVVEEHHHPAAVVVHHHHPTVVEEHHHPAVVEVHQTVVKEHHHPAVQMTVTHHGHVEEEALAVQREAEKMESEQRHQDAEEKQPAVVVHYETVQTAFVDQIEEPVVVQVAAAHVQAKEQNIEVSYEVVEAAAVTVTHVEKHGEVEFSTFIVEKKEDNSTTAVEVTAHTNESQKQGEEGLGVDSSAANFVFIDTQAQSTVHEDIAEIVFEEAAEIVAAVHQTEEKESVVAVAEAFTVSTEAEIVSVAFTETTEIEHAEAVAEEKVDVATEKAEEATEKAQETAGKAEEPTENTQEDSKKKSKKNSKKNK